MKIEMSAKEIPVVATTTEPNEWQLKVVVTGYYNEIYRARRIIAVAFSEKAKEYTLGESLALSCARNFGSIDDAHHKMWVIDQMCRHITGDDYKAFVTSCKVGEDGPDTYKWDTGIAP